MARSELHVEDAICAQRANDPDDEVIAALAGRQGGVVSRKQLLARGISARSIAHRITLGRLRVIHRGVYAVGHDAIPIRGRLCAALLVAGPGSALSHRTAAYVDSLLSSMPQFVEVTTTRRAPRNRPGLVFHHAATLNTTRRHGLPITTPIRTLQDLAATRPHHEVERAASEALVLKLVTHEQLKTQRGPGARVLANLVAAPTQSGLERAFLKALLKLNLPQPLTQHRIGPYTVDFYWPTHDLVVETDGDRYHDNEIARRRDRRKDAELRRRGCTVVRVPEDELAEAAELVALQLGRKAG
jgi:very-short-patch-repair endonuclease